MGRRSKRALIFACASKVLGAPANAGVCINIFCSDFNDVIFELL
jgi:hypothetical protein